MELERNLQVGEVRSVHSNNGKNLEVAELLFSPNVIAKLEVDRTNNVVKFSIDDTDLKYRDLECELSKDTLKNLFLNVRQMYLELESEEK